MSTALKKKHQIDKIYHHKCKIFNRNWRMLPTGSPTPNSDLSLPHAVANGKLKMENGK